ncbi:MAG: helix-turn-helix domain-containing protein, partial [Planctomycetes bacterium]|nr:helix-turn-helix domain-containing protein [Planctomycetota bacterium]
MPNSTTQLRKPRSFHRSALSPNQAARILGITGEAVKQWIYAGKLPATKLSNGYYRIKHTDLAQYLLNRRAAAQVLALASTDRALETSLAHIAKDLSHSFSAVPDTISALKQFQAQAPNLLVVDLDGFMEGWKLIRKVRGSVRFGSPKILLLSQKGLSDKETSEAVRLGVSGCL